MDLQKGTSVLEELTVSIFRIEEIHMAYSTQRTSIDNIMP
jgi:hypothetical protein